MRFAVLIVLVFVLVSVALAVDDSVEVENDGAVKQRSTRGRQRKSRNVDRTVDRTDDGTDDATVDQTLDERASVVANRGGGGGAVRQGGRPDRASRRHAKGKYAEKNHIVDAALVDEEAGVVYAQVEHGDHTHSRVLFHPGHETLHGYLVTGILLTLVGSQIGLWAWQKRSPHTFRIASLGGLLAVPPLFSIYAGFYRMLFVFVAFVALLGRLAFIASRRPLDRTTPRKVYKFFLAIYQLTYGMAWLGYILILIELVLGIDMIWPAAAMHVTSFALLLIFYGAYFGVLERDIAELCADRMASTMGLPVSKEMPQTSSISLSSGCSLCAEPFAGEGNAVPFRRQIGEPASGSRVPETLLGVNSEKVFTLNCGHRFHESCIRGWTIVGKKDTCSSCAEKVRISEVLDARQPWQKAPVLWNQVLNAVRFILFWNPVILVVLNFLISRIDEWDSSMLPEGLVSPGAPPVPVDV